MKIYLDKRLAKVQRFTRTLESLGFAEKAAQLRNDPNIVKPEVFNVYKAWIEYINRLFGVLAGLFGLACFVLSFRFVRQLPGVTLMATLGLVMLVFNAWLGSIVVATNLLPGIITLHFLISFLSLFFFMRSIHLLRPFKLGEDNTKLSAIWWGLFTVIIAEVVLGTLARERVEYLQAAGQLEEHGMISLSGMGGLFAVHRFLPGALLVYCIWLYRKYKEQYTWQSSAFLWLAIISLVQISMGAFNIVMVLPAVAQVSHIVLGAFMPVMLFYLLLAKPAAQSSVSI